MKRPSAHRGQSMEPVPRSVSPIEALFGSAWPGEQSVQVVVKSGLSQKLPGWQSAHDEPLVNEPVPHTSCVGAGVGPAVGARVGVAVGARVGVEVGARVGVDVGFAVGAGVGFPPQYVVLPMPVVQLRHTVAAGCGAYVPLPQVVHWKAPDPPVYEP
mgnify:CR=1 FL=1